MKEQPGRGRGTGRCTVASLSLLKLFKVQTFLIIQRQRQYFLFVPPPLPSPSQFQLLPQRVLEPQLPIAVGRRGGRKGAPSGRKEFKLLVYLLTLIGIATSTCQLRTQFSRCSLRLRELSLMPEKTCETSTIGR